MTDDHAPHGHDQHGHDQHGHDQQRHDQQRHPHGGHLHAEGHGHDQGLRGALRYLRLIPQLWRSEVNDAVVRRVDPRPGERVLDIGAGMGAGAVAAAATGARVVAVEPTPFMRSLLQGRLRVGRLGKLGGHRAGAVEVVTGAAERLPVADGCADAVWAVNTMHHWSDLGRGVAEIARVLAPGGRVLLVDEDFGDPRHPEHGRCGDGPEGRHGFLTVDPEALCALLRDHGLTSVETVDELAGRPVLGVSAQGTAGVSPT